MIKLVWLDITTLFVKKRNAVLNEILLMKEKEIENIEIVSVVIASLHQCFKFKLFELQCACDVMMQRHSIA